MKKQFKNLLLALIVIPCMIVMAACSGHRHSWATTWSKDADYHWYACSCGEVKDKSQHNWNTGVIVAGDEPTLDATGTKTFTCQTAGCGETKTDTVAKLMPLFANLEDFLDAVLDEEGNFSVSLEFAEQDNVGNTNEFSATFGVDELYSFGQVTYTDGELFQTYCDRISESLLACYNRTFYNESWTDWGYDSGDYKNAFLSVAEIPTDYMPYIFTIDILQNETFVQDQSNSNKYSFQDDCYTYVIEISAEDVILTITGEYVDDDYEASGTAIYTFTSFGTTEVEIPAATQEVRSTALMFGDEPDFFFIEYAVFLNDSPQWTWEGNRFPEINAFLLGKGFINNAGGEVFWNFDKNLIGNTFVCIYKDRYQEQLVLVGPTGEGGSMYAYYFDINEREDYLNANYYDEIDGVSYDGIVSLYSDSEVYWEFVGETDRTNEFKQVLLDSGEWELDESYNYFEHDDAEVEACTTVYIENDMCYIQRVESNGDYSAIRLTRISD